MNAVRRPRWFLRARHWWRSRSTQFLLDLDAAVFLLGAWALAYYLYRL